VRTSSLVEENCLQRRKIELGGDQHFLYRMAAEEWRGWVWRCVHMEEGRGAVGVGSAMEGGGSSAGKGVDVAEVAAGWAPTARSRGNRRAVRSHGPMWEKSWACGPLLLRAQANKNSKFFDLFKRISNGSDLIRLKDELPEF
jgi:hypothetical protein